MYVIGTAGHVDHGKSALVQALTGINPDRLREEQEREMTIDLGFAWLTLPSGHVVSIVDVPGHEDFIKNMLAGVGGIDLALFVVATDEAVMPQTREHLGILDLLEVRRSVVALTKSDLAEDDDWLELVVEEVRDELEGTALEEAEIVPCSAHTGDGLPALLAELDRLLATAPPPRDIGQPRLPIDRVFSMSGFGTVATGTLIDGHLRVGEEVTIVPGDLMARVRGLQSHRLKLEEAAPGSRVAANLTGVDTRALSRGQVLARPGWIEPTTLVDAQLRCLRDMPLPLKHNMQVDFFSGSAGVPARVRLLDSDSLLPGQTGWAQFRLFEPIAVVRGDHYIVRLPSPSVTLGGGIIVQPHPLRRHRRFRPEVIATLEALAHGSPEEVLLELVGRQLVVEAGEVLRSGGVPRSDAMDALRALVSSGQLILLSGNGVDSAVAMSDGARLIALKRWGELTRDARTALGDYHRRFPLRLGMPREELKSRLRIETRHYAQILDRAVEEGILSTTAATVRLAEHHIVLTEEQRNKISAVMRSFSESPFAPPSLQETEAELGAELLQLVIDEGTLVKVSDGVLFSQEAYAEMERRLVSYLREQKQVTVAQVRDLFGTSRRYALALLEHADRVRLTKRMGDVRVLR